MEKMKRKVLIFQINPSPAQAIHSTRRYSITALRYIKSNRMGVDIMMGKCKGYVIDVLHHNKFEVVKKGKKGSVFYLYWITLSAT